MAEKAYPLSRPDRSSSKVSSLVEMADDAAARGTLTNELVDKVFELTLLKVESWLTS